MQSISQQHAAVKHWNTHHPVGTRVLLRKDNGSDIETTTRSKAEMLSGHTAVIWLEGVSGCYALDRVHAFAEPPAPQEET